MTADRLEEIKRRAIGYDGDQILLTEDDFLWLLQEVEAAPLRRALGHIRVRLQLHLEDFPSAVVSSALGIASDALEA